MDFAEGQVVTVFRSRLHPSAVDEYEPLALEMSELARQMPGYVDHKTFVADDGERVTLVTFDSAEHQKAWRTHPRHLEAQRIGRDRFYSDYSLQVAECTSARGFTPSDGA
jgi:heme-degrading monooxygenase HmoA